MTNTDGGLPKIAYLTGEYPRATDTFIQREVAELRKLGFSVDTFAVRRPGEEHMVGPQQREGAATTTYLLEAARGPALLTTHVGLIGRSPSRYLRAARLAWRTKRAGVRGSLYQLFYFLEAGMLASQLRARGVDHLHNHFGDTSCTVAMLAAELADAPFSFTLHGPGIFFEAHTWRLDEKLRRAAFCSCISYFARSQAAIFGGTEVTDRLHIIHCGIDPAALQPVTHRPGPINLIFVGRVVELKGMAVLLDALAAVRADHPDTTLTVVGDGPDRDRFEKAAAAAGLAEAVDFVGAKSQAEVAELLGSADIFTLPSFAEGVPVVLMEAMAAGLPVVTTMVGGIAELVDHEVNGFLLRPGDPVALTEALSTLAADPELRARFGTAGRAKVSD
ncbi:MAG: glycosyltransferase family 4 protein, partial [Actinomycetota bacterium]